jgi:hypothetical protein
MIYADDRDAILVTSNRNCALAAPRKGVARAVWLDCVEEYALDTTKRVLRWFELRTNLLPQGRVLRCPRNGDLIVLRPKR